MWTPGQGHCRYSHTFRTKPRVLELQLLFFCEKISYFLAIRYENPIKSHQQGIEKELNARLPSFVRVLGVTTAVVVPDHCQPATKSLRFCLRDYYFRPARGRATAERGTLWPGAVKLRGTCSVCACRTLDPERAGRALLVQVAWAAGAPPRSRSLPPATSGAQPRRSKTCGWTEDASLILPLPDASELCEYGNSWCYC